MASGDLLAWINADDLLLAGAVRKAAQAFAADPEAGMVYGDGYLIDERGAIARRFPFTEPFNLWRLVYYGDTMLQQAVFMSRGALDQTGLLDAALHWGLDWDLFIRLGKSRRARYLPEDLACLREYGTTKTSTGGWRRVRELARVIKRHAGRRMTPSCLGYAHGWWHDLLPRLAGLTGPPLWGYLEGCQGWYPDHAAGREAHFLLPLLGRSLVLEGRLPQLHPEQLAQTLTIRLNGREAARRPLALGAFRLIEPVPEWAAGEDALRVDLTASTVIARRYYPLSKRTRNIAYFLDRVDVEQEAA